jgi:hypothetical protein
VTYFPHFLSRVIFGGMLLTLLAPRGPVAALADAVGLNGRTLLSDPHAFRSVLVGTSILKEFGWTAIIYLAAFTAIEWTARIAGTSRAISRCPACAIMVLVFVLDLGHTLDAGFEQVFVLYNPAVYAAYVLSRRGLPGRGFFTAIVVIALVFNAGIIPGYLLVRARHRDQRAVLCRRALERVLPGHLLHQ